jgi:hypothetical protein
MSLGVTNFDGVCRNCRFVFGIGRADGQFRPKSPVVHFKPPLQVIEKPTEPRPTANPPPGRPAPVERVVQPLMIPLVMIVSLELCDGSSKVALADRYDPIETFLFDGSHEAFGVGIRIGRLIRRLHDADPLVFY